MQTTRHGLIAGLFLLVTAFSTKAVTSFDTQLAKADSLRTSNVVEFNRTIAQLDQQVDGASIEQRMQLRLLHAYQPLLSGDYAESITQLQALMALNPSTDLRYRAGSMIANNFALKGQFPEALGNLETTLPLINKVSDREVRHQGLLVAAIVYNMVGQYQLGQKRAEQLLADSPSGRSKCFAGSLRIEALQKAGQLLDDAEISSVEQLCEEQGEGIATALARTYRARNWLSQGRIGSAIDLLKQHAADAEATHYPRAIGEVHALLAELSLAAGDLVGARSQAQMVISIRAGISNSPPLVIAYKTLYEIADRSGDPVAALKYYQKFAAADKAYLSDVKARELAYQLVRQESLQKNQQIELLNRQNAVLQLQQQVDKTSAQNSRLLMLVVTLLAALIGYWAYKTRRMHSSLRRMAETDALTGICNRHHFTVQAEKALAQCALAGEPAALLMFDLDHFKAINDSYGHTTGDWTLKRVADTCKHFCRRIDHLGRIGGEEFAILLHGCDLHVATRLAEDCRVRLAGIDTHDSGFRFTITASFGVSATSLSGYDLAKLLSHADLMLYRAKREGRNRVRTYAPEMPITLRPQAAVQSDEALPDGQVARAAEIPSGHPAS